MRSFPSLGKGHRRAGRARASARGQGLRTINPPFLGMNTSIVQGCPRDCRSYVLVRVPNARDRGVAGELLLDHTSHALSARRLLPARPASEQLLAGSHYSFWVESSHRCLNVDGDSCSHSPFPPFPEGFSSSSPPSFTFGALPLFGIGVLVNSTSVTCTQYYMKAPDFRPPTELAVVLSRKGESKLQITLRIPYRYPDGAA